MTPRILTPAEIAVAGNLRAEGKSVAAIAKRVRITRESISVYLKNPDKYVQNVENGMKISEIISEFANQSVIPLPPREKTEKPIKNEKRTSEHQFQRFNYKKESSSSSSSAAVMRKTPSRAATSINKNTGNTEKFYRVLIKHRAVIEYLTRNGHTPEQIHREIERVYGAAPDLQSVQFWAAPYRKDRRSKFESTPKKKSSSTNNSTSSAKMTVAQNGNSESVRKEVQKAPKNEKYFLKFKFANKKFGSNGK